MTYEELKRQVKRLSETIDRASADDPALVEKRIELRQLLNRMDIAAVPAIDVAELDVDFRMLIDAVDEDIQVEARRANLVAQVGKVVSFVRNVIA